jgi:hypothetical protein
MGYQHDGEIFNSGDVVHAKLNPDDDIIIDNFVIPSCPAFDTITTAAYP